MSENSHARLAVAAGLVKQEAFDQAIAHLKALIADEPRNELALGMLAAAHAQIGLHDRAIAEYRQVLEINPENWLARFQLGLAQLLAGRPGEALETWEPMRGLDSDFMANFHSALALLQLERPDEARPLLARAKTRMPANHPLRPELERLLGNEAH